MKNNNIYNNSVHNRSTTGSILIWSVMLGFVMTSIFFFFGMRQRATITVQRDTTTILNAKAYLNSYAEYLEKNAGVIGELTIDKDHPDYDYINVTMSRNVNEIEGFADMGQSIEYIFNDTETVFIEWNKCSGNSEGDLIVNGTLYEHDIGDICGAGDGGYDDIASGVTVVSPVIIETLNAPIHFRITGDGPLQDNQRHLTLSTEIDYGKTIKVERTF